MAIKKTRLLMMLGGRPTVAHLRDSFIRIGMEHQLGRPLSIAVEISATPGRSSGRWRS
jgi:hypothetical protein